MGILKECIAKGAPVNFFNLAVTPGGGGQAL